MSYRRSPTNRLAQYSDLSFALADLEAHVLLLLQPLSRRTTIALHVREMRQRLCCVRVMASSHLTKRDSVLSPCNANCLEGPTLSEVTAATARVALASGSAVCCLTMSAKSVTYCPRQSTPGANATSSWHEGLQTKVGRIGMAQVNAKVGVLLSTSNGVATGLGYSLLPSSWASRQMDMLDGSCSSGQRR